MSQFLCALFIRYTYLVLLFGKQLCYIDVQSRKIARNY